MWRWMKKNRWLAIGLVTVMLFTLLPTNLNWADIAIDEPERASSETRPTEQDKSEEVTTAEETADGTEATTAEAVTTSEAASETVTEAETTTETATVQEMTDNGETVDSTTEAATENVTAEQNLTNQKNTGNSGNSSISNKGKKSVDLNKAEPASNNDMSTNPNFHLTEVTLDATYTDKNNVKHSVALSTTENTDLPADAELYLLLKFLFSDGDAIEVGKEYVYNIPKEIRVDVNATHQLTNGEGESIGEVHISPDGTLTFVFNDNVTGQKNGPFYVEFEGGFSSSGSSGGEKTELKFQAPGSEFDFKVNLQEPEEKDPNAEPGELGVKKSGTKKYVTVDGKEVPVIEWTVELDLNGRETFTGDIEDVLPKGLKYARVEGYPKLSGGSTGEVTCTSEDKADKVSIHVEGANTYWRTNVTFCTYYDNDIFADTIISNTNGVTVNNTVNVEEDGADTGIPATGSAYVTPDILSKSGTESGGVITWTVTLNRDQLNIGGTTYTDTFKDGYKWYNNVQSVTVQPTEAGSVTCTNEGFTFTASSSCTSQVTLTYQTQIEDYTRSSYDNEGTLKKEGEFDATTKAGVKGYNLLDKVNTSYNEVTKQLTWEITVNAQKYDKFNGNVTLTDVFNPSGVYQNKMELVDIQVFDGDNQEVTDVTVNETDGTVTFSDDQINGKTYKVVVTTKILPEAGTTTGTPWKDGDWVTAYNTAKLTWGTDNEVQKQASRGFQYKTPELITKDGKMNNDGTIDWVLHFTYQNLTQESVTITDTLPEGMELVEGSCVIMEHSWTEPKVSITPEITSETVVFKIDSTSSADLKQFLTKSFEIHYKTRATNSENAQKDVTYTNKAEAEVEYEGGIKVTDEASKEVTGKVGGTLGKEAVYKYGENYVDWKVTVNKGRYTLKVKKPIIRDHLADYFTYVEGSAKLALIKEDGTTTPVTDFTVTVINNEMVVELPEINNEAYEFTFQTRFNVSASKLTSETIKNSVDFVGDDFVDSVTSNEVKNVHFSSSSAGAYIEKELRICKVDEEGHPLAGATFELYYQGNYITTVTSDSTGYAVFKGISSSAEGYEYVIKETAAPDGYEKLEKDIQVKIEDNALKSDSSNGVRYYEEKVTNKKISHTTTVSLQKVDEKGKSLKGAGFTVYSDSDCKTAVAEKTTDNDGKLSFTLEIPESGTKNYYVKETTVPDGYIGDEGTVYTFTVDADGKVTSSGIPASSTAKYDEKTNTLTVSNTRAKGTLTLLKKEKDSAPEKMLSDAEFTLYADEQCSDEVATKKTESDGKVVFDNLVLGQTYYYRETKAPDGYLLDDTVYSVTVGTGKEHTNQESEITVENEPAKGAIRITKTDNTAKANKLKGVTFELYDESDQPYPAAPAEQMKVVTDANGVAVFEGLPFGTYIVKEKGALDGYRVSTDSVKVTVDSVKGSDITIVNEVIRFNLKVEKKDDSGNPLAGVLFQVRDKATNTLMSSKRTGEDGTVTFEDLPYGEYEVKETEGLPGYTLTPDSQEVTKENIKDAVGGVVTKTFTNVKQSASIQFVKKDTGETLTLKGAEFTVYDSNGEPVKTVPSDNEGKVTITELAYGTYTVRETKPPEGYKLSIDAWTVEVNENKTYNLESQIIDSTTGETIVHNTPIDKSKIKYMSFKILKQDSNNQPLAGAEFGLYKKSDTFGEWELISTAYSDKDGYVEFYNIDIQEDDLEKTKYKIKEINPPYGYEIIGDDEKEYKYAELPGAEMNGQSIGYENYKTEGFENVPVIENRTNRQVLGSISVLKTGMNTTNKLAGAEFTLYRYNVERNAYEPYEQKAGTPYVVTTDKDGSAIFDGLPYGQYKVKETKAPKGYVLNALNEAVFTIPGTDGGEPVLNFHKDFRDNTISVSVNKFAVGGAEQLSGAVLELYAENDKEMENCLFRWETTNNAQKLDYTKLEAGNTYFIHESKAPQGYKRSEDVYFKVNSDGSLTYVSGTDGSVDIANKAVIVRDQPISLKFHKRGIDGNNKETAEFLSGAKISLIDEATSKEVYSFTTTGKIAEIPVGVLALPEKEGEYHYYTIRENSAPGGYAIAHDIRIAIDYDGQIFEVKADGTLTPLSDNTVTMTDQQYTNFYFAKRDAVTNAYLAGATFSISKPDDPNFATRSWVSSASAPHNEALDTGTYIFKEETAPAGYKLEDEIEFRVTNDGAGGKDYIEIIKGNDYNLSSNGLTIYSKDESIKVSFAKYNNSFEPLAGCKFNLYASDANWNKGNLLTEFTTEGNLLSLPNTYFSLNSYYILEETEAPATYTLATPIRFSINGEGNVIDADGAPMPDNYIVCINGDKMVSFQKLDAVTKTPVTGVQLTISSVEDSDFTEKSWIVGAPDPEGTTVGSQKFILCKEFKVNTAYTLSETATVNGYSMANSISFKFDNSYNLYVNDQLQQTLNIVMENQPLALSVDKYVLGTTDYLAGATMQVTDADGNVLEQWETGNGAHALDVSKLQVSTADAQHVYTLKEVKAPDLYALAQPISFTIDKNGVVSRVDGGAVTDNHLVVYDEYRGMSISKQDMGGKEVPGATLMITSEQDPDFVPKSWVTTDTPMNWNMDMFKRNVDYILTETAAPDGYAYTESIVFRIDDNGVIYVNGAPVTNKTVTMVDDVLKLSIAKRIDGRKKLLAGAKLEILDEETETTVYSWKSTDEVKEIPHKKLKASSDTTRYVYILRETKAPEGYEKAKDIRFYIDKQGNVYTLNKKGKATLVSDHVITMYDKKTDAKTSTKTTSKKTGDTAPVALAGIMFSLSLAGAGTAYGLRRRKARKK